MYELLLSIHNLKHRLIHRDVKRWHAAWKTANGARNLWPHGMGGVARMATPSVAKAGICILPIRGDGVLGWRRWLRREKRWAGLELFGRTA